MVPTLEHCYYFLLSPYAGINKTRIYLYCSTTSIQVKKNKSELYLKDESELDNYFVQEIIGNCVLKLKNGEILKGTSLEKLFNNLMSFVELLEKPVKKMKAFCYYLNKQLSLVFLIFLIFIQEIRLKKLWNI